MKNQTILLIALCSILFVSCAKKVPFTQELKKQYELKPKELKNLQFYLSGNIHLKNEFYETTGIPQETELDVSKNKTINIVKFNKTKGIVNSFNKNSVKKNYIEIEFEPGKTLWFGSPFSDIDSDSLWDGKYVLKVEKWEDKGGRIDYDSTKYWATRNSSQVHLMIKMSELKKVLINSRKVRGISLE